jgi:RES domain-containing protein
VISPSDIARCQTTSVAGIFERHTSLKINKLVGSRAGGRWGPTGTFPVLYLGRPQASVIVEAYRHLVEATEGMTSSAVGPRRLWSCEVAVTNVLDLRIPESLDLLGLSPSGLTTSPRDYVETQAVAIAAHQLELHGIIAPAATGLGETLALFEQHLPVDEYPTVIGQAIWDQLPADPRQASPARRVRANDGLIE